LVVFMGVYNLSLTLAGPFYSLFMLEYLKMPYSAIQLCVSLYMLINLAATPFWGYLIDKYGCNAVLRLSGLALAGALPFWVVAQPGQAGLIFAAHFVVGLTLAGVSLAPMNLLLKLGPESERQMVNGFYYGCNAVGSTLAPLLGAQIMDAAQSWQATVGGVTLTNYHLLFALALTLRFVAPLFLSLAPEPGEVPAHRVAWQLLSSSPLTTFFHLFRLRLTRDVTARAATERRLGMLRSSLAVDDLVEGLNDPSPTVRREAARALGEIGDEPAAAALLAQLERGDEDLLPEVMESLGKTGDERAIPPLLQVLRDPGQDHAVRRAAALAAARFDTPEVRAALLALLGSEAPTRLAAVAADSLGQLREWRALDLIYARLATEEAGPVRGQLANALARLVGDEALLYMLLKATSMDREVAVDRLLRSLARRCERRLELPEAAAWLQEALRAYQQADFRTAGQKLALLGRHLAATRPDDFQSPVAAARLALLELLHEAAAERPLSRAEVLLGMVAARELLHRLAERT
jgi:HEAT repeat protein